MALVALVSRNPGMSMALAATEHSVEEIRPGDLEGWLAGSGEAGADALVLDLGSPTAALSVVGDLRAQGRWVPVLLVATSDLAWSDPDLLALSGVDILPLPLDPQRLQSALTEVLKHPRTPPRPQAEARPHRSARGRPGYRCLPRPRLAHRRTRARTRAGPRTRTRA